MKITRLPVMACRENGHFPSKTLGAEIGIKNAIKKLCERYSEGYYLELKREASMVIWVRKQNRAEGRVGMRTLLRKTGDGRYFAGPDRWTGDAARAFNFKSIDRALRFISVWNLKEVEIAFSFNGGSEVTTVPLEKIGVDYSED